MLLTVWGAAAQAAVFADDFETGTTLSSDSPAGKWNAQNFSSACPSPASCSIAVTTGAARRGGFGMEFVDNATPAGGGTQGELRGLISAQPNIFGRFWFRSTASNNTGSLILSQVINNNGAAMIDLRLVLTDTELDVGGFDAVGGYQAERAPFELEINRWYLMEYQVQGFGTPGGALRMWVDGALKVQITNRNYTGLTSNEISLGEPFSDDRRFAGRLQYDDIRIDSVPMASKWALSVSATPPAIDGCTPVTATLQNSLSGAPAPAPYDVVATLSSTGATGGFFSDAACSVPTTTLTVSAGAQTGTSYFRPTGAGTASLSISHLDFLGATALLQIPVGGGSGVPPPADGGAGTGSEALQCPANNPFCSDDLQIRSSCGGSGSAATNGVALSLMVALSLFVLRQRRD